MEHEYKIITLTERGANAADEDLAVYEQRSGAATRWSGGSRSTARTMEDEDIQLDAVGEALLLRLQQWRSERAARDGMPAYVIAHNKALVAVAAIRPSTRDALIEVPGFGPSRAEKYGDELLALIEGAS